ncbi:nucleotidyltransferase [Jannaschia pagri]|uniref:Nucleotidyltransferase n=1 Tax=Jannaschia pagri TaxID=2829797 RepID=A0ABQ4NQR2_9RHOB|nr:MULTISPECIES: nucleotidyltransferase family protein [unclassified Jannaschia]GIT92556.1 nucleotidyltransferase [Jannaschia sp. AI_61]GIT96584.1 nucleotidyltransferase [Jannaschia sp. AI_62]
MIPTMIFAAGLGTRMRPLTDDQPKAMVRVAGRPMIDHALAQVDGPVVVNTHHFAHALQDHLANRPDVTVIHEEILLETGGGLRNALPLLGDGPVMTLNSDSVWTGPRACDTLRAAWDPERMDGLLLMVREDQAVGRGGARFALGASGQLSLHDHGLIATGVGIVKPDGLRQDPREVFSLRDLWFAMMDRGRLCGVVHPGRWADVGSPGAIPLAEAMLAEAA